MLAFAKAFIEDKGMRIHAATLVIVLLAGCAGTSTRQIVTGEPRLQTVVLESIPMFGITELIVGRSHERVWVGPTRKEERQLSAHAEDYRFEKALADVEPIYKAAAQTFLDGKGKGCTITETIPVPRAFGFEFGYVCK